MPLYDYKCPEHGVFQELAPMREHDQPKPCPQCAAQSARVIVLPPEIARVVKEQQQARERNEKARESPDVMTAGQYQEREAEKAARQASPESCRARTPPQTNRERPTRSLPGRKASQGS